MSHSYKKKAHALSEPLLSEEDEVYNPAKSDRTVSDVELQPSHKKMNVSIGTSMPMNFLSGPNKEKDAKHRIVRSKSYQAQPFGSNNYFQQQTLRHLDFSAKNEKLTIDSPIMSPMAVSKHAFDNVRDAQEDEIEINYELQKKRGFERQNFDPVENEISHIDSLKISLRGKKLPSRGLLKWFTCIFIGVMTGMCMVFVTYFVGRLQDLLWYWYKIALKSGFGYGFLAFYLFSLAMASIAGICVWISPRAAGSGIPEVKAYLNGSSMPALFYFKTLISKLVGVIGAVAGSFMVGKEGPMVHSGAAIASQIGRGGIKFLPKSFASKFLFGTDRDKRDLISCGAAAGVSAAFGAPIGGMVMLCVYILMMLCVHYQYIVYI